MLRIHFLIFGLLIGTRLSAQQGRVESDPLTHQTLRGCEGRCVLLSGGSFDLKTEGADLVLEPRNQEALTAIGFPGTESPSREYIGLTKLAVEKLIQNDLKAFRKEAGTSRLMTWFVKKSWKAMVDGMGSPKSFEFIGTIPDWEQQMVSIVKLQLDAGPQFFWLNWKGRKVKNVGHGHRVPGVPWFTAGPESTFARSAAYPGRTQWTRLSFDVDSSGTVVGLRLYSADGLSGLAAQKNLQ